MRIGSDSRKRGARARTVLVIVAAAVMMTLITVASTGAATPGTLDPAYGTGGKTTVSFRPTISPSPRPCRAMAR